MSKWSRRTNGCGLARSRGLGTTDLDTQRARFLVSERDARYITHTHTHLSLPSSPSLFLHTRQSESHTHTHTHTHTLRGRAQRRARARAPFVQSRPRATLLLERASKKLFDQCRPPRTTPAPSCVANLPTRQFNLNTFATPRASTPPESGRRCFSPT